MVLLIMQTQKILILGATSAIAEQTARLWAKQGHALYLIARKEARLQMMASDLKIRGAFCVHWKSLDFAQNVDYAAELQTAYDALGGLDTVLIAYGTLGLQKDCEKHVDMSLQILQTNMISPIAWLTLIANQFEQQGHGTIVVIASVAGLRGRASNYVYGASKGGLTVFLQGLRQRLSKKGIHVLTVLPGFVDTPMIAHLEKNILWAAPQRVASDLVHAVESRKNVLYTPWFWRFIMGVVLSIPERIFKVLRF